MSSFRDHKARCKRKAAWVNEERGWVGCFDCAEDAEFESKPRDPNAVSKERGTHFCDNCCKDLLESGHER